MLMGPDSARVETASTIGSRLDAATYKSSYIRASPQEEVALMARPPAAAAPMQTDMELCSDSTVTSSV